MLHAVWRGAGNMWRRMGRVKTVASGKVEASFTRSLTIFDVTLLGVFVLVGVVARDATGPAVLLSLLLAAPAALLAALCHAELGARMPKAASVYVSAYVAVGEFWAFIIGWNLILEYMIGAALVARVWSGHIDSLFGGTIKNSTISTFGSLHDYISTSYVDPLAFSVTLVYCGLLAVGLKCSTNVKSAFIVVNMAVVAFAIVFGLYWADISNWQGPGGFAPYGGTGVVTGAAVCFCALVGFASVASWSEDARDDARSVPLTTVVIVTAMTIVYILVAVTLTLMVPYRDLHVGSALPDAMMAHEVVWAKYIVSLVSLCGLTIVLFGALLAMSRCVYSMACDGLVFMSFSHISEKTRLPVLNMMLCGLLSAIAALLLDVKHLVELMSIGVLMVYTIVTASVIILRYQPDHRSSIKSLPDQCSGAAEVPPTPATPYPPEEAGAGVGGQLLPRFPWVSLVVGRHQPGTVVCGAVAAFAVLAAMLCTLIQRSMGDVSANRLLHDEQLQQMVLRYPSLYERTMKARNAATQDWAIVLAVFLSALLLAAMGLILVHAQNRIHLTYRMPLVPLLPLAAIFANMAFMVHLDPRTWLGFALWTTVGLLVYFCYGVHNSREREPVSSYTTLLPPSEAADAAHEEGGGGVCVEAQASTSGGGVVNAVQTKLSQVGSKVANFPASLKGRDKTGYGGLDAADDQPILTKATSPATKTQGE